MTSTKIEIKKHLDQLIGLSLCLSYRVMDMLILQFGEIHEVESITPRGETLKGAIGDFALHIQCPWRLENSEGIITGRGDLYLSAETEDYFDTKDDDSFYEAGKNLQDRKIGELLKGVESITDSYKNVTEFLVVEDVTCADFGEATIYLSGGYRLRLFPSSSVGEHWRLFSDGEKHFVVED